MIKTNSFNGLRTIIIPVTGSKTVTVLVLVGTGSKYENKKNSGISHFLEHMYFKGTKKRPKPKIIAETLDKVGGSYNAFTGEEYTGYYAKVAASHFNLALDWVSDIFLNSVIPGKEVTKEKNVIIEEINMIKDHPMSYVQELWTNLLYKDQPSGWSIAGSKESVMGITRKDLISYMNKNYSSLNTVICIAGAVEIKSGEEKVKQFFKNIKNNNKPQKQKVIEKQKEPQILLEKRSTDQVHMCLGTRSYSLFHKDRYVLKVIETILGRMMSSRLFIKIREELGLAYYIKTDLEINSDTGFLVTQAGVDIKKADKAVTAIMKEYKKMKETKVSLKELNKAKENIKGRMALSLESSDSQALFYGIQELIENRILKTDEIFRNIDKVTSDDILRVARDIFKLEKINLAMIGPFSKKDSFKKLLKF